MEEGVESYSTETRVVDGILAVVGSVTIFFALSIVCEEYLCPCIDEVCKRYKIPDDIAGATLLAVGNAAPEISMNIVSTINGKVDMGLSEVFGSGLIAFGFIPPLCALAAPQGRLSSFWQLGAPLCRIDTAPVIRDAGFYVLIAIILCCGLLDGRMELYESISLVLVYVMYVGVIAKRMHDVHAEQAVTEASVEAIAAEASEEVAPIGKVSQEASRGTLRHAHQRSASVGKSGGGGGGGGVGGGVSPAASDEVLRQEAGAVYGEFESGAGMEAELGESGEGGNGGGSGEAATLDPLVGLVRLIRWVYSRTIPFPLVPLTAMEESVALLSGQSSPTEVASPSTPAWRVWSGVAVSLAYVALLSNMALKVAEDAAIALGLSRVVASATLLAAGAQVPDTLGSIAMSKAGLFNGAMSNAVGSQVANIGIGVGIPFSLYSAIRGKDVVFGTGSTAMFKLGLCLLSVVCTYALLWLPLSSLGCSARWPESGTESGGASDAADRGRARSGSESGPGGACRASARIKSKQVSNTADLVPCGKLSDTAMLTRGRSLLLLSVASAAYVSFVVAQTTGSS